MCASCEAGEIGDKKFATPYLAVGSEAGSVQGHAQHSAAQMVLRHATRGVRGVGLHAELPFYSGGEPHASTHVAGVEIIGGGARHHPEKVLQSCQRLLEKLHGLQVLKIANMLAQNGVTAFRQTKSVFQLPTKRQH